MENLYSNVQVFQEIIYIYVVCVLGNLPNGGLQTLWYGEKFSKKFCMIQFNARQIFSRMVVIW